jgi:hypothetical protein
MFYRLVLKVTKVLHTSSVIIRVKFVRSLTYLLATATSMNLTNSSGARLGITICVAVVIVVMAGTIFLITPMCVFLETRKLPPCFGHLLLEFPLERPPLCLRQIFHRHPHRVVRPNLGLGSTILQVHYGFDKST